MTSEMSAVDGGIKKIYEAKNFAKNRKNWHKINKRYVENGPLL